MALDTFGRLDAQLEDRDARHGQRLERGLSRAHPFSAKQSQHSQLCTTVQMLGPIGEASSGEVTWLVVGSVGKGWGRG